MRKYRLNRLVKRPNGTSVMLPPIEESVGSREAYLKALRKMLRGIAKAGRTARTAFDFESLAALAVRLGLVAESTVSRILYLESQRHTETFMATAKRALGVDLRAVVRQEDLGDYLRQAGLRNAGLIKGLSQNAVERVQQTVSTALINGTPAKELSKQLTEQFGIADRRAQLIAQDQMAKLNSDMNRIRHEQAGVTQYKWLTSRDERVRARHRALEGKIYTYGEPTGAEGGLPPGQPIRCRCVAQAQVQF